MRWLAGHAALIVRAFFAIIRNVAGIDCGDDLAQSVTFEYFAIARRLSVRHVGTGHRIGDVAILRIALVCDAFRARSAVGIVRTSGALAVCIAFLRATAIRARGLVLRYGSAIDARILGAQIAVVLDIGAVIDGARTAHSVADGFLAITWSLDQSVCASRDHFFPALVGRACTHFAAVIVDEWRAIGNFFAFQTNARGIARASPVRFAGCTNILVRVGGCAHRALTLLADIAGRQIGIVCNGFVNAIFANMLQAISCNRDKAGSGQTVERGERARAGARIARVLRAGVYVIARFFRTAINGAFARLAESREVTERAR